MTTKPFSDLSYSLTKKISQVDKKKNGIYFTPHNIIKESFDIILDTIEKKNLKINTILEPSCGSCEYINFIDKSMKNVDICGIEYNSTIYDNIKNLNFINNVKIVNDDFLKFNKNNMYDLIIGNPPYYVLPKKNVEKIYLKYFDGRPNIFILFIIKSLMLLNNNGILSFVLPKNFLNCLYYDKLRKHIFDNYKIIDIFECSSEKFIETEQETIIFILQKNTNNKNNMLYCLEINGYTIFNTKDNIIKIKNIYKNSNTLDKLNFNVGVGNVVWNQVKDILTDDINETRLIYSSDIINNTLTLKKYKDKYKKNFIKKNGNNDTILVVNRGYGKGKYNFNYCIIDTNQKYLIENHLIVIKYKGQITKTELIKAYTNIINSFNNENTYEFINIYFGNNAINTTELQYILPIFTS
jgi:adenine-specific DNA-methyltransferase